MSRRIAALLAAVICLGATPTVAQVGIFTFQATGGARPISTTAISASFSGSVVIAFHGDQASGCAALGVCDYSGVIVWRPSGGQGGPSADLQVDKFRRHGSTFFAAVLAFLGSDFGTPTGTVVVHRAVPGGTPATCGDSISGDAAVPLTVIRSQIGIQLLSRETSLFESRCAGPLDADLANAMPGATLALRAVLAGHRAIALNGTRTFAAGGFAGTVHSTLTLRLGRTETSNPNPRPRRGARPRFRIVTVPIRLTALTGTVAQTISGVASPEVCAVLDSCGLRGTITVRPHVTSGTGSLNLLGRARRPYRDFLRALGLSSRGRGTGFSVFGSVDVGRGGTVATSIVQGSTCQDVSDLLAGVVGLVPGRDGLNVEYAPFALLKGRCPGPVMGSADGSLASGMMALRALGGGRVTIALRSGGFSDDGFSARVSGSLRLTLTFGRPHQQLVGGA